MTPSRSAAWRCLTVVAAFSGVIQAVAAQDDGTFDVTNCAVCQGLQHCTAMNGKLLFDPVIGYTRERSTQLEKQGVCEDIDAKTLELSLFGTEYQFKDTPRCRELVWNYHCLSWVAKTFDRVIGGAPVSCANAPAGAALPLPPCRSLCVEVADQCVFAHFYRDYLENVCGNVPCVSEEEETLSGGVLKQKDCVKGAWESVPNTSFSRCSIREYVPPKALAVRVEVVLLLWSMACFIWVVH
ncbi:hypothetical protein ATCC90586_005642 [Pythium insidiosum]|nr:hypothetical protein ATCC90586_005642 [Pythium insidiosum]